MRRAKKMRQHVEKREGICRTKKLVVLGRGDESATRQTLARSARGAAAEAAAVIGASESPRRRSCSNCSCDRRRPSPSGWSTHRSIAGTARRRTRPRAGRAASARRSAVPPSPPGWPRAADHRRLKQTAQRPRRDEEVSIMPTKQRFFSIVGGLRSLYRAPQWSTPNFTAPLRGPIQPHSAAGPPRGSFFGLTQLDGRKRIRTLDHREKLPLHHCTTSGVVV